MALLRATKITNAVIYLLTYLLTYVLNDSMP